MKQRIVVFVMLALVGAALVASEKSRLQVAVGPTALLYFLADTQRELTRLPAGLTRLSDEEEIRIGDALAKYYSQNVASTPEEATENQRIESYLIRVGGALAGRAHRKLPYRFHYIADPNFINAFALPGGHVFIGRGLLALMDTEDELASVLGHEIEHIDHYHCAERVQFEARLRQIHLGVIGELASIPVEVFEAGYTKEQELEADREGARLLYRSGYSPRGAVRLFQKYEQLEARLGGESRAGTAQGPAEELSGIAIEVLRGYFRSHPPPAERRAVIERLIVEESWERLPPERALEVGNAVRRSAPA